MFEQQFLYEDDTLVQESVGLFGWDTNVETIRVFGVMSHGGIIHDAAYVPDSLQSDTRIMEFSFTSGATGTTSSWRSVETHYGEDRYTESGQMEVDGEWQEMSFLTFVRKPTLEVD